MCSERGAKLFATDMRFCIDNGTMIAQVGVTTRGVLLRIMNRYLILKSFIPVHRHRGRCCRHRHSGI
jgi:tRNA A37 threonylcarbamoyltransferase TsaD